MRNFLRLTQTAQSFLWLLVSFFEQIFLLFPQVFIVENVSKQGIAEQNNRTLKSLFVCGGIDTERDFLRHRIDASLEYQKNDFNAVRILCSIHFVKEIKN
ncbi:MAG: hypothetical protein DWH80_07710 [Planctomycetota bacterium]|nr:MAG: hypothetical protein DWH80_07710 [Planctomycetota bacterium]